MGSVKLGRTGLWISEVQAPLNYKRAQEMTIYSCFFLGCCNLYVAQEKAKFKSDESNVAYGTLC
jgi:hypothetical protein